MRLAGVGAGACALFPVLGALCAVVAVWARRSHPVRSLHGALRVVGPPLDGRRAAVLPKSFLEVGGMEYALLPFGHAACSALRCVGAGACRFGQCVARGLRHLGCAGERGTARPAGEVAPRLSRPMAASADESGSPYRWGRCALAPPRSGVNRFPPKSRPSGPPRTPAWFL